MLMASIGNQAGKQRRALLVDGEGGYTCAGLDTAVI